MSEEKKSLDLTTVVSKAITLPGVKVSRTEFLTEQFNDYPKDKLKSIIELGPIEAGCSRQEIKKLADKIIKTRTATSTGASFLTGIPGGLAMAVTIPADMLQFYGVALRMAQELVYLYGEKDIWCDGTPNADKVTNQLILYCGVMLGATGAAHTVRLMSSALAKQALKKLPQMALTKTIYYPVIKSIMKFFGVSLTKNSFAKGVSKAIPIAGGFFSAGLTLASMLPMGNRLKNTLDKAHFDYSKKDFEKDLSEIHEIVEEFKETDDTTNLNSVSNNEKQKTEETIVSTTDPLEEIKKAKELLDNGIITQEEFNKIKTKMLEKL